MKITCKICWITLGLFLLGNVILLGFWSFGEKHERRTDKYDKDGRRMKMRDHLKENAKINDAQFSEMYELWQAHAQRMHRYQHEVDSLRQVLMKQSFTNAPDSNKVTKVFNQLAQKQRIIEETNYYHFRNLRSICKTDEQRELLDKLFRAKMKYDGPRKRYKGHRHEH